MKENTVDQKINALFVELQKQKEDVLKAEENIAKSWKTNCVFKFFDSEPLNLQTAKEDKVHIAFTQLLIQKDYSDKASKELGINKVDKYLGYSYEDWKEDFLKNIARNSIKEKKSKLADLEKRLSSIVSPEQKRQMELDAITEALGQ